MTLKLRAKGGKQGLPKIKLYPMRHTLGIGIQRAMGLVLKITRLNYFCNL